MTTEAKVASIRLTDAQIRDLRELANDPHANVGGPLNPTMTVLQRHGLVSRGRDRWGHRWEITDAGRAHASATGAKSP